MSLVPQRDGCRNHLASSPATLSGVLLALSKSKDEHFQVWPRVFPVATVSHVASLAGSALRKPMAVDKAERGVALSGIIRNSALKSGLVLACPSSDQPDPYGEGQSSLVPFLPSAASCPSAYSQYLAGNLDTSHCRVRSAESRPCLEFGLLSCHPFSPSCNYCLPVVGIIDQHTTHTSQNSHHCAKDSLLILGVA